MPAELRTITPPAPDILGRAVVHEQNKHAAYPEAIEQAVNILTPLLVALSEPERISRSATISNGVQQEDLWRRQLDFSPRFMFQGKDYYVGVRQVTDKEGLTRAIIFETGVQHDDVFLGGMHFKPNDKYEPHKIVNERGQHADRKEVQELIELAVLVAEHAPKQAEKSGLISHSWMRRRFEDEGNLTAEAPFKQGFPRAKNLYTGKPKAYELILGEGTRVVANVTENGNLWEADLNPDVKIEEEVVAAWRQVGNILPNYHAIAKYPTIYKVE